MYCDCLNNLLWLSNKFFCFVFFSFVCTTVDKDFNWYCYENDNQIHYSVVTHVKYNLKSISCYIFLVCKCSHVSISISKCQGNVKEGVPFLFAYKNSSLLYLSINKYNTYIYVHIHIFFSTINHFKGLELKVVLTNMNICQYVTCYMCYLHTNKIHIKFDWVWSVYCCCLTFWKVHILIIIFISQVLKYTQKKKLFF